MKVFVSGRQGGKTTAMIEWLREDPDNRMVVCATEERAKYFRLRAGSARDRVVSYTNYQRSHGRPVELGIDDLDFLLATIFTPRIGMVTLTGEFEGPRWGSWGAQ